MNVETTVAPASEPVSLADVKEHLRVDHSDEDAYIGGLIAAARARVEVFTRLALVTRTVEITVDEFPAALDLPVWPVASIESVAFDDATGDEVVMDAAAWQMIKRKPRRLIPAYGTSWPTTSTSVGAVRVTAVVGFGDADAVPADLVAACKLIIGSLYERRENDIVGVSISPLPVGAEDLMTPHIFYP